jgi:hypothetical protein
MEEATADVRVHSGADILHLEQYRQCDILHLGYHREHLADDTRS